MTEQIILNGITKEEFKEIIYQCVKKTIDIKNNSKNPKEKSEENYLTRKEVAKLLRVSLPTLHEWTKEGILISHRIGKRVLYRLEEIKSAISQRNFTKFKRGGLNVA